LTSIGKILLPVTILPSDSHLAAAGLFGKEYLSCEAEELRPVTDPGNAAFG